MRTVSEGNALVATPCWGSNGTEIYYTTFEAFNPDLAGVMLESKYKWWVSRRAGFNLSPSWSEAAQKVALTLTRDGNSEIYTITREGKDPRRLTTTPVNRYPRPTGRPTAPPGPLRRPHRHPQSHTSWT
jgi:TolB protein